MAERTRFQAIETYLSPLQQAVSCVTPAVFTAPGFSRRVEATVDALLNRGEPVRLRGPERIQLRVRLRVRVTQADPPRGLWEAETAAYEYRISDQDDREIVAYHWHPDGQSHVRHPHLHLATGAETGRRALLTAHLPTGHAVLQDVTRLTIDGFAVEPVRRDWDRVLREGELAGR